jgi:protein gp37
MSDNSAIEWTDHTFNPWWGCSRVSPACVHCYADSQAQRYGHQVWRRKGPRRMLSEANWARPLKWNRDAERAGIPAKVFCASMADVFEDHPQVAEPRERLWDVIEATPWLQWQLLTKRIENVAQMAPWGDSWPTNVWLGTSVENQKYADLRIPLLLEIPAYIRFLSCEPLLGPVTLAKSWRGADVFQPDQIGVDWIIAGGESGPGARRSDPEWFCSLRDQCAASALPFFMKQAGTVLAREWGCSDRKGHVPEEWREAFPRQFPLAADLAGAA